MRGCNLDIEEHRCLWRALLHIEVLPANGAVKWTSLCPSKAESWQCTVSVFFPFSRFVKCPRIHSVKGEVMMRVPQWFVICPSSVRWLAARQSFAELKDIIIELSRWRMACNGEMYFVFATSAQLLTATMSKTLLEAKCRPDSNNEQNS